MIILFHFFHLLLSYIFCIKQYNLYLNLIFINIYINIFSFFIFLEDNIQDSNKLVIQKYKISS